MADAKAYTVAAKVASVLATVSSGSGNNYTLSATDQIMWGQTEYPPLLLPNVQLTAINATTFVGDGNAPVNQFSVELEIVLEGHVNSNPGNPKDRFQAAANLALDCKQVLEADRSLTVLVNDILISDIRLSECMTEQELKVGKFTALLTCNYPLTTGL